MDQAATTKAKRSRLPLFSNWYLTVGNMNLGIFAELSEHILDTWSLMFWFPNRAIMGKYLREIAWETEVWVADAPSHLIHFNGVRFLGPY